MTLRTALEIAGNYPENIKIDSCLQENGKYASFAYLTRDGAIHKTLLSTTPIFDTKESADSALIELCKSCVEQYQ